MKDGTESEDKSFSCTKIGLDPGMGKRRPVVIESKTEDDP
jgi:hypothetical protein